MSGLLAVAQVRRMLLELEVPDDPNGAHPLASDLNVWVRQPLRELDGLSPAELLTTPSGARRLRAWLFTRLK